MGTASVVAVSWASATATISLDTSFGDDGFAPLGFTHSSLVQDMVDRRATLS